MNQKPSPNTDHKSILNLVLIAILIGCALLFGLMSRPTEMGLMIGACAICLIFANIDQIQSFKGAGFEAEMKKAVENAYATTESLRSLAKPLVLTMLESLTYNGRWDGIDKRREHQLKEELENLSDELGICCDEQIESALHRFYIMNGIDLLNDIERAMNENQIRNISVSRDLQGLYDRTIKELPSIETVRKSLSGLQAKEITVLDPSVEDYAYYREYKKLRKF